MTSHNLCPQQCIPLKWCVMQLLWAYGGVRWEIDTTAFSYRETREAFIPHLKGMKLSTSKCSLASSLFSLHLVLSEVSQEFPEEAQKSSWEDSIGFLLYWLWCGHRDREGCSWDSITGLLKKCTELEYGVVMASLVMGYRILDTFF